MLMLEKIYAGGGTSTTTTSGGAQQAVPTSLTTPLQINNLGQVFALVINLILGVGWALVFVMLALGFVQYVLSKGEKTAVENAQKWLTYAVIGGVGLFFVVVLKNIIPQLIAGSSTGPVSGVVVF